MKGWEPYLQLLLSAQVVFHWPPTRVDFWALHCHDSENFQNRYPKSINLIDIKIPGPVSDPH